MKQLTRKFADVIGFKFERIARDLEIADDSEAVQYCFENEGFYFQTYELPADLPEGEEFCTEPMNRSERSYVSVPEIHPAAAVLKRLEGNFIAALKLSDMLDEKVINDLKAKLAAAKENGPGAVYINEPGSRDGYIRLNPGDRAYDMHGHQMWPKPAL